MNTLQSRAKLTSLDGSHNNRASPGTPQGCHRDPRQCAPGPQTWLHPVACTLPHSLLRFPLSLPVPRMRQDRKTHGKGKEPPPSQTLAQVSESRIPAQFTFSVKIANMETILLLCQAISNKNVKVAMNHAQGLSMYGLSSQLQTGSFPGILQIRLNCVDN